MEDAQSWLNLRSGIALGIGSLVAVFSPVLGIILLLVILAGLHWSK